VTNYLHVVTTGYTDLILSLRILNLNGMKARCMDQCIPREKLDISGNHSDDYSIFHLNQWN